MSSWPIVTLIPPEESPDPAPGPLADAVRAALARSMPRPQMRGVGLCIPRGVDPADLTAPEVTPIDGPGPAGAPDAD